MLSPTSFSLSVHSTAATLFSISRKDKSPTSVIAAGADSLAMGLLEAVGRLHDGENQVLLVAHDELLPLPFQPWVEPGEVAYGLAMLLRIDGAKRFSLTLGPSPVVGAASRPPPLPLRLAEFLDSDELELRLKSELRSWTFRRHA